jgi:hypothetical protein
MRDLPKYHGMPLADLKESGSKVEDFFNVNRPLIG